MRKLIIKFSNEIQENYLYERLKSLGRKPCAPKHNLDNCVLTTNFYFVGCRIEFVKMDDPELGNSTVISFSEFVNKYGQQELDFNSYKS